MHTSRRDSQNAYRPAFLISSVEDNQSFAILGEYNSITGISRGWGNALRQAREQLVMQLTMGRVVIELRPDLAPAHVARIKELVDQRFYDGLAFHRVIEGFMAQTGDPRGDGTGGTGHKLKAEFSEAPHERGTVSMARAANADSGDSQFFICLAPARFLDRQYTVWGHVSSGIEFVDQIKKGDRAVNGVVTDPDKIVHLRLGTEDEDTNNSNLSTHAFRASASHPTDSGSGAFDTNISWDQSDVMRETSVAAKAESKTLRLARYLKEFVGLRSTTIRDVDKYDSVLWFAEMPKEPECRSPAWNDAFESGDPWLEVRKQQFPKLPAAAEILAPWLDHQALGRATDVMPPLRASILEPDTDAAVQEGEDPPLTERFIIDYPEVSKAYERYRPGWMAWSAEYRRRSAIQRVYAELFHLHTQIQKQGEVLELVLGLGLLDWPGSSKPKTPSIRRHIVTARVDLHFDATTGVIRLDGAADGAQLRIEDDMLEPELRPERGSYESVGQQLSSIDDDIWDRQSMFVALRTWAESLHADSEWSPELQPANGAPDKPRLTFAPALILRSRTQTGMVRAYDAIIRQLSTNLEASPIGWESLISDGDDRDESERAQRLDENGNGFQAQPTETYFPLPANHEQRRIVEALNRRRGVLVQGPPGTGKSHTIANLMCHLLAAGKRVLVTAETGRALQVLKDKLPDEIQPLCVSLLGQSGDAFAELNSAVQGITTRFATWSPGAYDQRMEEIDREIISKRRAMAEIDTELRSLREAETHRHVLLNGEYQGSASAIAERVAKERTAFDWLRVPRDAADFPPLNESELRDWLNIRRTHDAVLIKDAKLRTIDSDTIPSARSFADSIGAEQEAKAAIERLSGLKAHAAYRWIGALSSDARVSLDRTLRELGGTQKALFRLGYEWMPKALKEMLGGRRAHWQTLLDQSRQTTQQIERLLESRGSSTVSIPADLDLSRVRADALAVIKHLEDGGGWTMYGFFTPAAIKERLYLRDNIRADGQPADTTERLNLVCTHVDLCLSFSAIEEIWTDFGGLPRGVTAPYTSGRDCGTGEKPRSLPHLF